MLYGVCVNDSLGILAFSGSILFSMCGFFRWMLEHVWPVFEPSQLVNRMLRGLPSINSTFMINRGWCTIPQMLWKACAWRRTCQPGRSEFDTGRWWKCKILPINDNYPRYSNIVHGLMEVPKLRKSSHWFFLRQAQWITMTCLPIVMKYLRFA